MKCLNENCQNECTVGRYIDPRRNNRFCSQKCAADYHSEKAYREYLNNNEQFCRSNYTPKAFKKYFIIEQDYKCAVCKTPNKWNGQTLVFVMDHIDGDASNNKRANIRLVCPNCDSQLPTFKRRNKNSARKNRFQYS